MSVHTILARKLIKNGTHALTSVQDYFVNW